MPRPFQRIEVGNTIQLTWTGSVAPDSVRLRVTTGDSILVDSGLAVSSGITSFYRFVTLTPSMFPQLPIVCLAEWTAVASTHVSSLTPFITRYMFEVVKTSTWGTALP